MKLIEDQNAPVLFLTGDQHYVEVLKSPRNVRYKTFEIMAAGINKNERPGRAPNRVEGPDVTLHNAPILDVFFDEEGEKKVGKIEGYDARVYLHESDHLNGITYKDRVSKMKWDMAVKRTSKQIKKGIINA